MAEWTPPSEVQATSNLQDCHNVIPVQQQWQHDHHNPSTVMFQSNISQVVRDICDVILQPYPYPSCYYQISHLTQSSVTSVMSMFSFILTLLPYYQISEPKQSSVTSVIFVFTYSRPWHPWCHCSVAPYLLCYYPISDFTHPPWHPWCQCSISSLTLFRRHQNSHLRSMLQTNFRSHTVVRDTCDIHV